MRKNASSLVLILAVAAVLAALPAAAQVTDYKDIQYPPLPQFKIEKPTVFNLKNGMTVFLMEDHELPLIEVDASIRTGSAWEPAGMTGLASLMGEVERTGGTDRMSGDEIDDYLAARAAEIETGVGDDAGFASMNCLKGDFDDVFRVFADILRDPKFDEKKLDLAKVQANTGIARRNDNVMQILFREFPRLIYGNDSPLSRMQEYATIAAVTRDDIVAWHKKYYVPNNVYLGLVGDFDSKEMRKKIEAVFGDWAKGPAAPLPPIAYRKEPSPGVYFIEKSDVTQAYVAMGHLGLVTGDAIRAAGKGGPVADYYAVQVMNEVLGGGFASRMFSNVRSKKGLAYNVFGSLGSDYLYPGVLRAGLQTKSASMSQGIDAVKAELVGIIENPPNDAELKRAKESILNSFVFNYDSKGKILAQQMHYAFYGLPADFLEQYRANIEKVTREDVARVARKYVRPDQLTLLVVGKEADFDKPLSSLGKVTKLDITIPAPADKAPKVAKTAAGLEAGKKIFAKAAATLAGKNPGEIKALQIKGNMVISMQGQSMTMGRSALLVFPDKVREVVTSPMGEQVLILTGSDAFGIFGGKVQPLPPEAVAEQRKEMARDLRFLMRMAGDPKLEAVAAGDEDVGGTKCQIVSVTYDGVTSRLWVDPTGRVLKQVYQGENPLTRTPGEVEYVFSDYRDVQGRMMPHKQVMRFDGQDLVTMTIDSITVNPPVDETLFQKPPA